MRDLTATPVRCAATDQMVVSLRRAAAMLMVAAGLACSGDSSGTVTPPPPPGPVFDAPDSIALGETIGVPTFPAGDAASGGQGDTVHGIACDLSVPAVHVHQHLTLIADGVQRAIPLAIGVLNAQVLSGFVVDGSCFYWFHTHDASGIIHLEAPVTTPLTLGDLFAVWGEPLGRAGVAGFQGTVTAFVDTTRYDGDLGSLVLTSHQQITLVVGTVPAHLPTYIFPSVF